MRHHNTKALTLACAIAVSAALAGCGGSESRQEKYLERAQEFFAAGNYEKARIEVKNVLQINSNNADARFLLASMEEKDRNWGQMYANLNAALETNPDMAPARVKLAQLLIASDQLDKANEELDKVLAKNPKDADALVTRAIILTREKKADEALAEARKALAIEPGHINATTMMATIYLEQDPAQAEQLLADSLKLHPTNTTLRLMQIKVFGKQNKTADVIATFKYLMAEQPDNLIYPAQLANFYMASGRLDDAEALLREIAASRSDKEEAKLLLVDFLARERSLGQARTELQKYSDAEPGNYKLRSALARLHIAANDIDKAIATYRYTIDKDGRNADAIDARNRVIELLLAQKKRADAEALIKDVLELEPENGEALIVRARLALNDNDPNSAINDLRTVLKNTPDSTLALAMLATAQERTGARNLALDNYQRLLQLEPKNIVGLAGSGRLMLMQNKLDEARKLLEQAHQQVGSDPEVTRLLIDVYSLQQQWDKALEISNNLLINQKSAPAGHYLTGVIHARRNELPQAIDNFKKALEKEPRVIEPLQMLVNTMVANKQTEQAIAYVEKHTKAYPQQTHAQELLAALYRQSGRLAQAEQVLEQLLRAEPKRVSAYRELAAVYALKKEPQKIEALYQRGLQHNTDSGGLLILLAEHYQASGRDQEALDAYNRLLKLAPQSPVVKNNLAVLLIEKFPTEENLRRAQILIAEFADSDNPLFLDTLGWLHYKMKNYPQSVALLENAVRKNEGMPELHYHLGMAYLKNNMTAKAKEHLTVATSNPGAFVGRDEAELELRKL
jgi:cellulose synthase operon protein C